MRVGVFLVKFSCFGTMSIIKHSKVKYQAQLMEF